MKTGFIYWQPKLYQYFVRMIYGKAFYSRYEIISGLLPDSVSVVDVCCGDCYINRFLRKKKIDYLGLDLNHKFVKYALKRGIKAELFNVKDSIIPRADYIIMQGSLYQFIPEYQAIVDKLFSAADKGVIISESTRSITSSNNPIASFLGGLSRTVDEVNFPNCFTKGQLLELFNKYNVSAVKEISGGRDLIGFFVKENKR